MTLLGSLSQAIGLAGQSGQTSGLTQAEMEELRLRQMGFNTAQLGQLSNNNLTLTTNGTAGLWASQNAYQNPIGKTNLDEGAWDVAITQLYDLWVVKFGSRWVRHDELDEFYTIAAARLGKLFKVEQHYVNMHNVYRIVE